MKKIIMLIVTLAMMLTTISVNADTGVKETYVAEQETVKTEAEKEIVKTERETAEVVSVKSSTYGVYMNTQFRASVPGGVTDQLGLEVYDLTTGTQTVYWGEALPQEFIERTGHGYGAWTRNFYATWFNELFWGTVLYLELDENQIISDFKIHNRYKSYADTNFILDPK